MGTFYDGWLGMWDRAVEERQKARKWIHEEEIEWVATQQDARVGLLVAPETGFRTWGTVTMVAEIPPGWHTGKHKHGEEAIHIVDGTGFSVVNDVRYDWKKNSTLLIPFGATHQHFNTGDKPARYFSALAPHLEHFVGMARIVQAAECGPTKSPPVVPVSATGFDERNRRIVMQIEEAPLGLGEGGEGGPRPAVALTPPVALDKPIAVGTRDGYAAAGIPEDAQHAHTGPTAPTFMSIRKQNNGFQPHEIEITGILSDDPRQTSGTHGHMEAMIYCLEGTGYTLVDDVKVPWKKGTCLHVQGPQTKHQHVNDGEVPSQLLRIAPALRYFFETVARDEFPYLYYGPRSELMPSH